MKHFSLTDWADFVRGVVPAGQSELMQKHLDAVCPKCTRTVQLWSSIVGFAKQEVSYSPPAAALRITESYFPQFFSHQYQKKGFQLARLTFDSFEHQAAEGIRGSDNGPRQLMYQFGDVYVDMRMQPRTASGEVMLLGQVLRSGQSAAIAANAPISLLVNDETVCTTATNELGEFYMSFHATHHPKLLVVVEADTFLVPLPDIDLGPS